MTTPITSQDIIEHFKKKKGMDEREIMTDNEHDSSAFTTTVSACWVAAVIKAFVLKRNPCDILAIQAFALSYKKNKDWKESKKKIDLFESCVLLALSFANLTYYLVKKGKI